MGDVLVTVEEAAGAAVAEERVAAPAVATSSAATPSAGGPVPAEEPEPYTGSVVGQLEEAPEEEGEAAAAAAVAPVPSTAPMAPERPAPTPEPAAPAEVLAMPSVRALAKELGVDLTTIRGTGPGGRILKQDVEDVAEATAYGSPGAAPTAVAAPPTVPPETEAPAPSASIAPSAEPPVLAPVLGGTVDSDAYGPVERVAFRGVRRTMARHMAESVAKQAQVTTVDEADVTIIRRIREKERTVAAERGVRLTYLAFVIKACTASLKRFPRLNAVLEESREEFVLKRYYNIGVAVDTKYGLVVPNIKDADQKSIFRIAEEVVDVVDRAGERRLDLSDLHGGTFTISNYGAIGSTFATPVINYPEVALLGMGRVRELPVVREGKMVARLMLPLSLTFDHQLIDGAEAVRFLNLVMGYLEDPDLLLLEGA